MRLIVTGGSSFVGAWLSQRAARLHEVVALHHRQPLRLNGVTPMRVDLRRQRDVARLQAVGADAVVHTACRIRADARPGETSGQAAARTNRQMMDAVLSLGLPVVYASSTVVHWSQDTAYGASRREDEERLAQSGLPYAILRPSAPYGPALATHRPGHKESFHTLVEMVARLPLVPVIGDGTYRRQPVHVADFADAVLALLDRGLPSRAFEAGGGEALSMDAVVATIGRALGRQPRILHLPKALFVQLARYNADLDPELLAAADEDELADPGALIAATGVPMRPFSAGVSDLVAAWR